jgi:hypothetical protein
MPQRRLDLVGKAHPRPEHAGHVAVADGPLAELGDAAKRRPGHRSRPAEPGPLGMGNPGRGGDQVPPGPEGHRHHLRPRRKLVAEEPRVDLALGRAPGEVQQPGVEDGHLIVIGQAHRLRDPHREHRGAEPMLQRLTHCQVSGQRQGPDGLGQPQWPGDRGHHTDPRGVRRAGTACLRGRHAQHPGRRPCFFSHTPSHAGSEITRVRTFRIA